MKDNRRLFGTVLVLSMVIALTGCGPTWSFSLSTPEGGMVTIDQGTWEKYASLAGEEGLPLEKILYDQGFRILDQLVVTGPDGHEKAYNWDEEARDVWLQAGGDLLLGAEEMRPRHIEVTSSPCASRVEGGIYDITPTASAALNIPAPEINTGTRLASHRAEHVLLLLLDGFGYLRYAEAAEAGLIPVLETLDPPLMGLTTYPPITTVSTASLLTGSEPQVHGVETRGLRKTDRETLLQIAVREGLDVQAVEGEALAFQLSGAEFQLSGDRDEDGNTDDNVLENTLAVLEDRMPDLFLVHFHGIDDMGHEVGPGHPREEEKIREVDQAVGKILDKLPPETLVIIFADHGMHRVQGEERAGNHGHLIPRDMLIPIWLVYLD